MEAFFNRRQEGAPLLSGGYRAELRELWQARRRRRQGCFVLLFKEGEVEARLYRRGRLAGRAVGPRPQLEAEPTAAARQLTKLLQELDPGLPTLPLLLLLEEGSLSQRQLQLPPSRGQELRQAIQWEMEEPGRSGGQLLWQALVQPAADVPEEGWAEHPSGTEWQEEEGQEGLEVTVLAVEAEVLAPYLRLCQLLGLPLEGVGREDFFSPAEASLTLNLLPQGGGRAPAQAAGSALARLAPWVLGGSLLLALFLSLGSLYYQQRGQRQLAAARQEAAGLGPWVERYQAYSARQKEVAALGKAAEAAEQAYQAQQPLLVALQGLAGPGLYLEGLSLQEGRVLLTGRSPRLAAVQDFCQRLSQEGGYGEARLLEAQAQGEGRPWLLFKIALAAKKEGGRQDG